MIKTQDVESSKMNRFALKTNKDARGLLGRENIGMQAIWKDKSQSYFKDAHHRRRCPAWGPHVQPAPGMSRIC